MSIELLTDNEFNCQIKKLLENMDEIKSEIDIYSILVDEKVLVASA